MREEQFDSRDVESVEIDQSYSSIVMRFDRPENEHQARFSIRYNIAAALEDGRIGIDTFTAEKIKDPAIQAAMNKVRINVQTQWKVGKGNWRRTVSVKIHLKDGRALVRTTEPDQILGSYKNPFGLDFIVGKFRENARRALPAAKVEKAIKPAFPGWVR